MAPNRLRELGNTFAVCPRDFDEYLGDMRDLSKQNPTWGDDQTLEAFVVAFQQPVLWYAVVKRQVHKRGLPESGWEHKAVLEFPMCGLSTLMRCCCFLFPRATSPG